MSNFRCSLCKKLAYKNLDFYKITDCDHPICTNCIKTLKSTYNCTFPNCLKKTVIGEKSESLLHSSILIDNHFSQIKPLKCEKHNNPKVNFCLDLICPFSRNFFCVKCMKIYHKNCNPLSILTLESFFINTIPHIPPILENIEKLTKICTEKKIKIKNLQLFKNFAEDKIIRLLNLHYHTFCLFSNEFIIQPNGNEIIIQDFKLEKSYELFIDILNLISQNPTIIDLNNVLSQLGLLISINLTAFRITLPHICHSKNSPKLSIQNFCCACDQSDNFTNPISELNTQLAQNGEIMSLIDRTFVFNVSSINAFKIHEFDSNLEKVENLKKSIVKRENDQKSIENDLKIIDSVKNSIDQSTIAIYYQQQEIINNNKCSNQIFSQFQMRIKTMDFLLSKSLFLNLTHFEFIINTFPDFGKADLIFSFKKSKIGDLKDFHKFCDKKGPTIVFILANNMIAGGYTDVNWQSVDSTQNERCLFYSEHSFLFSLTHKKVYKVLENKIHSAVYCHKELGPCFGGSFGCDIRISLDCNSFSNYSVLGDSYDISSVKNPSSELFGAYNFQVDAIEVYSLVI